MIDRSKFRKTSASQLAQADKDLNKSLGKKDRTNSNGHEFDEGANLFRIYPEHPEGGGLSFVEPKVQTFVPAMVQEKTKDGSIVKGTDGKPKMKLGMKPVWNTVVHGGMKKDLIQEFINFAQAKAKDLKLDNDDYKEFLKPIYGLYAGKGNKANINGINYPLAWVCYADKYPNGNAAAEPVFDEWVLKKSIKERLNKISAVEAANDPMGTNPFTDLEEGKAVRVHYDPNSETAQGYYTTELDNSSYKELVNGKLLNIQKTYPLTDEQLEYFMKQEPLAVKYGKKLATRKNFEAQLASLEILDAKVFEVTRKESQFYPGFTMDIFSIPGFNEVVLEIDSYYPEVDAVDTTAAATEDVAHEEVIETEEVTGDEFDLMDRKELSDFARLNKTGFLIKPTMTDDAIKERLREWKESQVEIAHVPLLEPAPVVVAAPVVTAKTKEEDDKEFLDSLRGNTTKPSLAVKEKEVIEDKPAAPVSAQDKLAAMRARMAGKTQAA